MPVQQTGQSTRLIGSDCDLLDDAHAAAVAHRRYDEVLDMDGGEVGGIEVFELEKAGVEQLLRECSFARRSLQQGKQNVGEGVRP